MDFGPSDVPVSERAEKSGSALSPPQVPTPPVRAVHPLLALEILTF
jgi:hypothetical protein